MEDRADAHFPAPGANCNKLPKLTLSAEVFQQPRDILLAEQCRDSKHLPFQHQLYYHPSFRPSFTGPGLLFEHTVSPPLSIPA
jgi:hypothetical protein